MLIVEQKTVLSTTIIEDPIKIIAELGKGISIPILPEFHKYIIKELKAYDAKAILLEEKLEQPNFGKQTDQIVGITVVYGDGTDTLFFGFFGVYDHSPEKISFLSDALKQYGKDNNYKRIRGRAYIYFWLGLYG
jgi:hypothetical protein